MTAAWVFDGVTGINDRHYLSGASDAQWIVERAEHHLRSLVVSNRPLPDILSDLVTRLAEDYGKATQGKAIPANYDSPAACLILAKLYQDGWKVLRLGDSILLSEAAGQVTHHPLPPSDLHDLESELRQEARRRRDKGPVDFKALLNEFKPRLVANRQRRNTPGSYGILVPDRSSLNMPEVIDLGRPESILLCTDGFYRAVDTYGCYDDAGLMSACRMEGGVEKVLQQIRAIEASDPDCQQHLRFKPADDASAVLLVFR